MRAELRERFRGIDSVLRQAYGVLHMSGYHLSQSTHTWWWGWDAPEVASSG
ncbi:hypothetical protein BH23ACT4_BH23ACT4_13750 [soil metagenome]